MSIEEYQKQNTLYIVIKDFYKIGSAVVGFTQQQLSLFEEYYLRCTLNAKSPVQVVFLAGKTALTCYGEYEPYTIYEDPMDLVQMCITGETIGEPLNIDNQ